MVDTSRDAAELSTDELTLIETRLANERKSVVAAYLLFLFLGGLGIHNFYLGRILLGVIELLLSLLGTILIFAAGLGIVFLIPLGILLFIDLFIIPGGIRKNLEKRRRELTESMKQNKRQAAETTA